VIDSSRVDPEVEGVAISASGQGDPVRAVTLAAAVEALWDERGISISVPFWDAFSTSTSAVPADSSAPPPTHTGAKGESSPSKTQLRSRSRTPDPAAHPAGTRWVREPALTPNADVELVARAVPSAPASRERVCGGLASDALPTAGLRSGREDTTAMHESERGNLLHHETPLPSVTWIAFAGPLPLVVG
jgi:hypothetical protein